MFPRPPSPKPDSANISPTHTLLREKARLKGTSWWEAGLMLLASSLVSGRYGNHVLRCAWRDCLPLPRVSQHVLPVVGLPPVTCPPPGLPPGAALRPWLLFLLAVSHRHRPDPRTAGAAGGGEEGEAGPAGESKSGSCMLGWGGGWPGGQQRKETPFWSQGPL